MSLLADEDDLFEEPLRTHTGSPLFGGEGEDEEDFQIHRPKDRKESRKTSGLWRPRQKEKELPTDKTPKKGKHVRSKSASRSPPDSPKAVRAVESKRPGKGTSQPSPNVKSHRKRYAQLGGEASSSESETEEDMGVMVANKAAEQDSRVAPVGSQGQGSHSPTANTIFALPLAPPPQQQVPIPTSPTRRVTVQFPVFPAVQETHMPIVFQTPPRVPDLPSPGFFHSPFPPVQPPPQPSTSTFAPSFPVPAPPSPPPSEVDWGISEELQQKCVKQFSDLKPEGGFLQGDKARDFFVLSKLPKPELSQIWRLADVDRDNALSDEEFCIAMKLVLMRRRGYDIPASLPSPLLSSFNQGPFTDSFVTSTQQSAQPQAIPPPPQQHRHQQAPPMLTSQSVMELPSTQDSAPRKPFLSQIVQQSAPDLLGAKTGEQEGGRAQELVTEDTHATNPILVEIGDTSTSETGPLVSSVEEPAMGKIISIGGEESEEEREDDSTVFLPQRKRTASDSSLTESHLPKEPTAVKSTTSVAVRRTKSLKTHTLDRPDLPPKPKPRFRTNPTTASSPANSTTFVRNETAPILSVQEPSPKVSKQRRTGAVPPSEERSRYSTLSNSGRSSDDDEEEVTDGKGSQLLADRESLDDKKRRGHARSSSLDLKKMLREEGSSDAHIKDLPSAVPPKPPPKPHPLPAHREQEEHPSRRPRSCSTGSISSQGTTPTQDDHSVEEDSRPLAQRPIPPKAKPRTLKRAPQVPPKRPAPSRPKPYATHTAGASIATLAGASIATLAGASVSFTLRDKGDLQSNIRSLKETNAALHAINKGLEEKLFKLMEDRIKLGREVEIAHQQQL